MNMNRLGKILVVLNTVISLVALSWTLGLFFQITDWGWKEPRSELGLRVPSEYDKRTAAFRDAVKARDAVVPALKPAQASLREAEESFPQNHLFYKAELARLESSPDPIEVKYVKKTGPLVLDTPGKSIGKPVLEEKVEGITKSYDAYRAELKKINEENDAEIKSIRGWTDKAQAITFILNGKDDTNKAVKNTMGVYALLDVEKKAQDQAKFEKEYLEPIWAATLQEADLYNNIRDRLQESLNRLRGSKKK